MFSHEITRNEIIASYIASAAFPLLGIPLSLYFLVKGRIFHFIGIACLSMIMFLFWVFMYIRYSSRISMIGSLIS